MPQRHLSVEKRARQNIKRNQRNRVVKSAIRGALKNVEQNTDTEKSTQLVVKAQRVLDRAAAKNVIPKKRASRAKSRLMRKQAAAAPEKPGK